MKQNIKDKFVFSQRNANIFGYNVGMTKDGKIFSYTTVVNLSHKSHRPEYEIEGHTVYEGKIEDLIAIKRYYGIDSEYIKNTTQQEDPLNPDAQQQKNKNCCKITRKVCDKIQEINKKLTKIIESEYKKICNEKPTN